MSEADLDKIHFVDPETAREREKKEREEQGRPSIDRLPPVDPLTGKRTEVLPPRPKGSSYPGTSHPRPMPMAGVPRGDRD